MTRVRRFRGNGNDEILEGYGIAMELFVGFECETCYGARYQIVLQGWKLLFSNHGLWHHSSVEYVSRSF